MNIRSQVTVLIAGIFLILGLAAILVGKLVIMPSFAQLERADAFTAMRRIERALDQTLGQVAVASVDWGNWADTYRFVTDRNPEFISANITGVALRQLDVNALLIVDRDGNVVLARDDDLKSERPLGLDLTARSALPENFPWRANLRNGQPARGLLRTNRGVLMLAAAPILDGNGHGPVRGMVLMGRLLNAAAVDGIAARAQAQLGMLPAASGEVSERLEETDSVTRVFRPFLDVYGKPAMAFRVDVPREVSLRGKAAVKVAAWSLLAAVVVVLLLLVIVLNRVILDPLGAITRHAVSIGEGADAARARSQAHGRDGRAGARVRPHGGARGRVAHAAGRPVVPGRLRRTRQGRAAQSRQRHDAHRRARWRTSASGCAGPRRGR